jgi:FkbM family methyltransferase
MIYNNIKKNDNIIVPLKPIVNITHIEGPRVEISNGGDKIFDVVFYNNKTKEVEHSGQIGNNCWIKSNKRYFIDWLITVDGEEYRFDLTDKRVYISLDSKSLGDTIAWFPYVEEFRKKHNCRVVCSTFMNHLFEANYPEIEFVKPGVTVHGIIAMYNIGWFYDGDQVNLFRNPSDFKKEPLQKTACDILGLDYQEVLPKLNIGSNITRQFKTHDERWLRDMLDEIFYKKEYDYKEVNVQPGDVVLDLGGNIGSFASYAISKGASKVYTVEPFEEYVDLLKTNLARYEDKVVIIPYGASNMTGESVINMNFENNTILDNVYKENNWGTEEKKFTIKNLDINDLLKRYNIERVDFLKVDIEGSEYAVFDSLSADYLKNKVERVAVEYHWNYQGQLSGVVKKLESCGFVVYQMETNSHARIGKLFAYNKALYKNKNRVCIALHSTCQSKYWNNPTGWQDVVDYLNSKGYEVVLISKEGDGYMGNYHPTGVTQLPQGDLESVINVLNSSKFFIGIGSGLSWLSWACEIPTVIISGFSDSYTEPQNNVIRIEALEKSCKGCFNKYVLDAGDWMWCPEHKGTDRQFECTRLIEGEYVINKIKHLL